MSKTRRANNETQYIRKPRPVDEGDHWTKNGWHVSAHLIQEALDREAYEPLHTAEEREEDEDTQYHYSR